MKRITIEKLINIDDTGMPIAPDLRQLLDKDVRELYTRDPTPDKRYYIAECGVIYYLGDPKSPTKQRGLSDEESLKEAIINFNLEPDYKPDELVLKLAKRYYIQNITEAGVALETLQKSVHIITLAANKINNILNNKLNSGIVDEDIPSILVMIDSVNKRVNDIPDLTKSLNVAYENLRNEEEQQFARGKSLILSSMNADETI